MERLKRYWQDTKALFSTKGARVSIAIFLGIVAIQLIIVLVSVFAGCSGSNWYTKVSKPEIVIDNVVRGQNINQAYLIVANPTSQRKHFLVRCCISHTLEDSQDCYDTPVIVPPRSDQRVRIGMFSSMTCHLVRDTKPGSAR